MKALRVALVACLVTACFNDYILGPPTNVRAVFNLSVRNTEAADSRYEVAAFLNRGYDSVGNVHAFFDSTVAVAGVELQGTVLLDHRTVVYRWADTVTGVRRDSIVVRTPRRLAQDTTVTLRVPMRSRDGPFVVDHVAGTDLLLRVQPGADTLPGFRRPTRFWGVEIRDARSKVTIANLQGIGNPTLLPIATQIAPMAAGDSLEATLTLNAYYVAPADFIGMYLQSSIVWTIRVVAP